MDKLFFRNFMFYGFIGTSLICASHLYAQDEGGDKKAVEADALSPKNDPANIIKNEKTTSVILSSGEAEDGVSLSETLGMAYMHNAELDSARAQLRSTDEGVAQALSGWRPSASVQFKQTHNWVEPSGSIRNNTTGTLVPRQSSHRNDTNFGLSGRQNIFAGGSTYAQTEAAKERVYAGRAGLSGSEQNILISAVQAYLRVITNEAILKFRRSSEKFNYKVWEQTQARYEVGEVTRTEVAAAEGGYQRAKSERITAEANVETSRATYQQVVGVAPGKLGKARVLTDLPETLEDTINMAKAQNPSITQAKHNIEASEYDVNTQIATLLPTVDVTGSVDRDRNGGTGVHPDPQRQTNYQAGLEVSMPVYEQGLNRSRIRQAHQGVAKSKVDLVQAHRTVTENATQAWENYIASKANVKSFMAQVKAQKLAVEGATEEALVGTKNILDVLQQEQELVNAQINLVQAEQNLVTASYQVLQAVGRLTAKDLGLNVTVYNPEDYYDDNAGALFKFWKGEDYRYVKDLDDDK